MNRARGGGGGGEKGGAQLNVHRRCEKQGHSDGVRRGGGGKQTR